MKNHYIPGKYVDNLFFLLLIIVMLINMFIDVNCFLSFNDMAHAPVVL